MAAHSHPPLGDVSCRATGYTIQQLQRMGLPTAHLTHGLAYTLDDLQSQSASIPWDDYLVFVQNSHTELPADQLVELCTSYTGSSHLRPFLAAAGLWLHPAKYYQWVAEAESGAIRQLFRCVKTRFTQAGAREVVIEEVIEPGFALPPDIFWETQSIAFGALTTYFGLGSSIVTWEPIERGAAFRVRLPRRRPVRFVLSWLASWFRRDTAEDVRSALAYGHERSIRLEREIADRKRVEAALRESEMRFRRLIENGHDVVALYDDTGKITYQSPSVTRVLGYDPAELLGTTAMALCHPDDRPTALANQAQVLASQEPGPPVELRCLGKDGSYRWIEFVGTNLLHEPAIGALVGNYRDITAQKQADDAIRTSTRRLELAFGATSDAIWEWNYQTGETYYSPRWFEMLGADPSLPMTFDTWKGQCHPDDFDSAVASIRATLEIAEANRYEVEFRMKKSDGTWVWILGRGNVVDRTPDGRPRLLAGTNTDITERKQAEAALRESELRYRTLIETSSDAIFLMDLTGHILSANPAAVRMHGYTLDELLAMRVQDLDLPDDAVDLPDRMRRLQAGESLTFEVIHRRKDGTIFPVEVLASAVEIGGEWLVIGCDRDITDRKRAVQALEEAEHRQRLALDAGGMGTWDWDIVHGRVTWDARQQELFGFAPGEYDGHPDSFLSRVHPDDIDRVRMRITESVNTGDDYEAEFRIHPRPGTLRWVAGRGRVFRDDHGHPVRMVGVNFDQTDRKRAILALEEAERRQHLALDAGRMGTWDWEVGSNRLTWDDREKTLFGFESGAFDGRLDTFLSRVHPDDLDGVRQVLADAAAGKDFDGEFRIRLATGEVRWVHGSGVTVPKSEHSPPRLVGINYDVTERKRAEQALVEEKSLLQAMFGSLPGIAYAFDQGGRYVRWNHNYEKLLGWSEAEMSRLTALDTVTPKDRERVAAVIRDVFVLGESSTELHALRRDGREIPLYCSGVRVTLGGEPCVVGYGIDISARLKAEAALRESEERLRSFVENAPAGVAMLDRDGRYLSYSHRWLTDCGLGDQNLVGRSHYEVFPEVTDRWKEIHRRCLAGVSERCEQDRFDRADGTVEYLRWEIQPWTDATGAVGGLVFFTELITHRVKAEEHVRASLREKEAMLKEIHHRVKNNLQVISSLLSLQAARVTHPSATDVLTESQNRVRAMALVHETLYRSDDLARVDLSRYLGELCGYLFRSYGVDSARVRLELDVDPATVSLDKTIPCGLVVNEIVSNSLKYAFPGTRSGTVTVGVRTRPDAHLTLTLADDGVGLPAEVVIDRTPSLGLQLVNILVEQLGGKLTVERSPGTRFVISFAP